MGEARKGALRGDFDSQIKLESHGARQLLLMQAWSRTANSMKRWV
jgi:hypothetical protein